jgi:hypothetical protein
MDQSRREGWRNKGEERVKERGNKKRKEKN